MVGIYRITSPSNRVYIGQSWRLEKRQYDYAKNPHKKQVSIYNSIKKYGWDAHKFEIIHLLPNDVDKYTLDSYECLYWKQYKDIGFSMLNIREPSSRGKLSPISIAKISASKMGKPSGMLGKKHSEETKLKMSEVQKRNPPNLGIKYSDERKKKISELSKRPRPNAKGRIPWNKGTSNSISDETRKKMSDAKLGKEAWNKGLVGLRYKQYKKRQPKK